LLWVDFSPPRYPMTVGYDQARKYWRTQ
jgi:hypothetical protein